MHRIFGRILRSTPIIGLIALTTFAHAAPLRPFEAIYTLSSGSTTLGEMRLKLELPSANHYRYTAFSQATGFIGRLVGGQIQESSEGSIAPDGIRPDHYSYHRKGRKKREVILRFDWKKSQVTNTVNDDPWIMSVPPSALDKLSVQLALMIDLSRNRQTITYSVADGGTLKTYEFEFAGQEKIETALGLVETVRVKRNRGRSERYAEFWCAPSWGYLPIQIIEYHKGQEHARLSLRSFSSANPSIP